MKTELSFKVLVALVLAALVLACVNPSPATPASDPAALAQTTAKAKTIAAPATGHAVAAVMKS